MLLIEIENGKPTKNTITFDEFKRTNSNTTFGIPLNTELLFSQFGYTLYTETEKPDASTLEKYFKFVDVPMLQSDKSCLQTWSQVAMTNVEKQESYIYKVTEVKAKRDSLLTASDWTQLGDVAIANKEAWAAYRQELRDVTKQEGYPWEVVWPFLPV